MRWGLLFLLLVASPASADLVVATKTIRANTVLSAEDVTMGNVKSSVGMDNVEDAIGLETRVVLYAGRPIRAEDLGPPALVERNQLVPIRFQQGGLTVSTLARSLDRGARGDLVRVMNVSSRTTVFGEVMPDGSIKVTRP